ncbi:MAG: hypothetical protein U9O94_10515, partial [Nanoarchaeota archaeon]|nr:hypothetical protein [Nanoarchaeota archaeon]
MKEYLITLFLLVLITACAPIVEEQSVEEVVEDVVEETDVEGGFIEDIQVEEPKEVVEEIILEEPEMEEIPLKEEVVIEIKSDSFYPTEKSIKT